MIKNTLISAAILSTLSALAMPVLAAETSIELINNSSSNEILINSSSTGSLLPTAPNPLYAYDTTNLVSITAGTVDAGAFTYQSCRFNWSAIKIGSIYMFSDGATPSSDCESQVVSQNFFTGEYSVQFKVK
ncbi:MAG: hypothetical protein COA42_17165 [Alteromonadaceae bacterium]|nr:MAG: hypothetical protein COA42_17165 [Alteromonadaceae bacterium]